MLENKKHLLENVNHFKVPMRLLNGKIVDLDNLQDEDIAIEQIVNSLSLQCRYNGQIPEFYSIAQHSMLVAQLLYERYDDPSLALCGLLHDAAEAYIGDIITPIKQNLQFFNDLEENILERILKKYDIYHIYKSHEPYIHNIDRELYYAEVAYFFEGATEIIDELPYNNREELTEAFLIDFKYYRSKNMRIQIEGIDEDEILIKYIKTLCSKLSEKEIKEKLKNIRAKWLQHINIDNGKIL